MNAQGPLNQPGSVPSAGDQAQDSLSGVPHKLIPTSMPGVFTTPPLPDDFDPNSATRTSLISHGLLWRRPEAGDAPALRDAWGRAFARPWLAKDQIKPEFEPQIGKTHVRGKVTRLEDGSFSNNRWSGGTIQGTWTGVIGYWVVPTATKPGEPQGSEGGWNSSSWVGLDGAYGSDDVLQAGVEQRVDASGNASYVAWYEWFGPNVPGAPAYINQTNIPNFAVSPGDTVYCSVQYAGVIAPSAAPGSPLDGYQTSFNNQQHVNYLDTNGHVHELYYSDSGGWVHNDLSQLAQATGGLQHTAAPGSPLDGYQTSFNNQQHVNYLDTNGHVHELYYSDSAGWVHNDLTGFAGRTGVIYFANETTHQYFSITLKPPPGASFSGNSAEWIMEAPDFGENISSLPHFTPVQFTSAICCGPNNTVGDPSNGDTWNIVGFGRTLTSVRQGHDTVTIDYVGP